MDKRHGGVAGDVAAVARPVSVAAALVAAARSASLATAAEPPVHAWPSSTRRAVVSIEVDKRHGGVAGDVAAVARPGQATVVNEVACDAAQLAA